MHEAGGAPGDVIAVAAVQEETGLNGARTVAHSLRPGLAIAVDVTHATDAPGIDETEIGRHHFGSGPVIERGTPLHPVISELLIETAEAEGIPYTLSASARGDRHRRRRDLHRARRRPDRARLGAAALHALAGRDGAARGRREHGASDRGVRAAPAGGRQLRALSMGAGGAPGALLILFDIDGTLLLKASGEHARAVLEAIEEVWRRAPGERLPVEAAGRTDTEIAREILLLCGVQASAIDAGLDDFREAAARRYARSRARRPDAEARAGRRRGRGRPGRRPAPARARDRQPRAGRAAEARRAAGIVRHFESGQGGFGSDSEDRTDLPPLARERAAAWNAGAPWPRERTVVVGDTPRDIACARADGVHVVAVTTGPYAADALAGADAVIGGLAELPGRWPRSAERDRGDD